MFCSCSVRMSAVRFRSDMAKHWPTAVVAATAFILFATVRFTAAVKCYDCSYPLGNCSETCEGEVCVNATTILAGKIYCNFVNN